MNLRSKREYIVEISLQLNNLQDLYLGYSHIKEIKEHSFSGLNNLIWLDLSSNRIREINQHSFDGLNNLLESYLSYNQITEMKDQSFRSLYLLFAKISFVF